MSRSRVSGALAAGGITAVATVAGFGFRLAPDLGFGWLLVGALLPSLWAFVEFAQVRGPDPEVADDTIAVHRFVIAFAGFMLATLIGSKLLVRVGVLEPTWLSTIEQLRWLAVGGGMVVFGNHLPTLRSPWPLRLQPFAWQQVHRFVGWTFVLGGLAIVVIEVLFPAESAEGLSAGVLAIALALALGRKIVSLVTTSVRSDNLAD